MSPHCVLRWCIGQAKEQLLCLFVRGGEFPIQEGSSSEPHLQSCLMKPLEQRPELSDFCDNLWFQFVKKLEIKDPLVVVYFKIARIKEPLVPVFFKKPQRTSSFHEINSKELTVA